MLLTKRQCSLVLDQQIAKLQSPAQAGGRYLKIEGAPAVPKGTNPVRYNTKLSTRHKESILDNQELIVAAHVRALATRLVQDKWLKVSDGLELSTETQENSDERKRVSAEWFSLNPVDDYIVEAYKLLESAAIQIRALR